MIWKGQSNFSLEAFISQHRNAFVSMEASAEHVQYQLPNEHSRVGFLLDAIQNSDAGLQAAIASVRTDDGPTGKRNNFEATASHLLPYDPVAKKRLASNKRGSEIISSVSGIEEDGHISSIKGSKPAIGKTGVHLRYHKRNREWRESSDYKPTPRPDAKGKRKTYTKKQIAALVKKKVKLGLNKSSEETKTKDDEKAYIMALIKETFESDASSSDTKPKDNSVSTLHSILKRAKNQKS
jgi:hypothetical protein